MINKTIHYCWFGEKEKPKVIRECIASWKKFCPDYEIKEWNEHNFDVHMIPYTAEAYDAGKWAFVSDYARLWIVYHNGGIYLDTDVRLVKGLDELLKWELFICSEDNKKINTGLGIGAKSGNKYIKRMMDDYVGVHFIENGKADLTACPVRNTKSLEDLLTHFDMKKMGVWQGVAYYPKMFFNPKDEYTGRVVQTDETIGVHLGIASWEKKRIKIAYYAKIFVKRIIGRRATDRIRRKRSK